MGGRTVPSRMMNTTNEERKAEKKGRKYTSLDGESGSVVDSAFEKEVKEWLSKMSDEERNGVITYTGGAYKPINEYLRNGLYGTGKDPHLEDIIRRATAGLKQYTLEKDIQTYRKSTDDLLSKINVKFKGDIDKFINEVKGFAGTEIRDKGFTSSSTSRSPWDGAVWYEIRVPSGTKAAFVKSISHFSSESEVLLSRGTHFKIVDAYRRPKATWLDEDKPVVVLQVVRKRVGKRG